ncbi:MAG TPA: hypothetical protein VK186_16585 [Candidatus Deferrimicrobium sp.]|nr:hypothetical protein [Candidatus Deferrimicrobium sp.]
MNSDCFLSQDLEENQSVQLLKAIDLECSGNAKLFPKINHQEGDIINLYILSPIPYEILMRRYNKKLK